MIKILELKYLFYSLLAVISVWIGACQTWIHPVYYGPLFLTLAIFFAFIGSFIIGEIIISKHREITTNTISDKNTVHKRTALVLAVSSFIISWVTAVSINIETLIAVMIVSALLMLLVYGRNKVYFLKYIILPLVAGIVILSGGLAVEPRYIWIIPGPVIPVIFTMIFILINEIIFDISKFIQEQKSNTRTIVDIIGVSKSLVITIILFIVFVLITFLLVFLGCYGTAFKIITIYVIDLPTLILLILIWGNPSKRMLSIGLMVFRIGWVLSMTALLIN